ncbi:MAG: hypothetical protein K6E54_04725 [Bacteroidaceae bacterium]|nr:hypothetical protein [Bacteroidaceae bacterium]
MIIRKINSVLLLLAFWFVAITIQAAKVPWMQSVYATDADVTATSLHDGQDVYIRFAYNNTYYYLGGNGYNSVRLCGKEHASRFTLSKTNGANQTAPEGYFYLKTSQAGNYGKSSTLNYLTLGYDSNSGSYTTVTNGNGAYSYFYFIENDASNNKYSIASMYLEQYMLLSAVFGEVSYNAYYYTPFEVVTEEQLRNEFEDASSSNLVDATFLINDPHFEANHIASEKASWKLVANGNTQDLVEDKEIYVNGSNNGYIYNQYYTDAGNDETQKMALELSAVNNSYYSVQQTVTNIPNGLYRLQAQGIASDNKAFYFFAGNTEEKYDSVALTNKKNVSSALKAYDTFSSSRNNGTVTINVLVENNTLVFGCKAGYKNASAFIDNFELYYLGEPSAAFNTSPASYTPDGMDDPWIEVKNNSAILNNPEKYFFAIWNDENNCFVYGGGKEGYQGEGYNTMLSAYGVNPLDSYSYMWEMYKTSDGKYILVNPNDRENMLQAETGTKYFRNGSTTTLDVSLAGLTLTSAYYNNWTITTSEGKYLHRWNVSSGNVVADNQTAYLKIYAIPRSYVVTELKNDVDNNYPCDFSLLLANPNAFGTSESTGNGIVGWNLSSNQLGWTKTGSTTDFSFLSGKSYFVLDKDVNGSMYQTVTDIPNGRYKLTAAVEGAAGGYLYLGDSSNPETANMSNVNSNGKVSVTTSVYDNKLDLGVLMSSYEGIADAKCDNFTLQYVGPNADITINSGDSYYIRCNIGSDSETCSMSSCNSLRSP